MLLQSVYMATVNYWLLGSKSFRFRHLNSPKTKNILYDERIGIGDTDKTL